MPNHPNEETRITFLPSRTYTDRSADDALKTLVHSELLLKRSQPYGSAAIRVRQQPGLAREKTLVVYMLRSDSFTADAVQLTVEDNVRITSQSDEYVDTEDDAGPIPEAPNDDSDFVIGAPDIRQKSVRTAIDGIYDLAKANNLSPTVLVPDECTVDNYKKYLCDKKVKGFVHIGHGMQNRIILNDGFLTEEWFKKLQNKELDLKVIFFDSCLVFAMQETIMNAGARTFIGGKNEIPAGWSEKVTLLFWQFALADKMKMGDALSNALEKTPQVKIDDFGMVGGAGQF